MKEKRKPRMSARIASPTLKWNRVERMATEAMILMNNPLAHHKNGTRSSIGV